MVLDWYAVTIDGLQSLWQGFIGFLPELVGALIIFVIGWFISVGVGRLVADILKRIKFNQIFERGNWKHALEKADVKMDPAGFIGGIFKWVLVIVFLLAAVDVLGLTQLGGFITNVLNYLPNVVVASLIFVVAVIVADISEKVLRAAVESTQVEYGHVVGVIVRWSIWVFAAIAILTQLGVTPVLWQTLFTGLVALVVIAGGLAFGLGGKDVAGQWLQDMNRRLRG
jgi:small-conductance mechanosensitive channel